MTDGESENSGNGIVNVNANIKVPGENLDKAAAEVLKSALNLPANEASGLLGDTIGIIGDRVKVFRFENRVKCLAAARDRLARQGLTLDQAKQISEGEAYDLLEGMGGADTSGIRRMWAGLMANAMDPSKRVSADKGYIRVLEALSSSDVVIINFLAAHWQAQAWEISKNSDFSFAYHVAETEVDKAALETKKQQIRGASRKRRERLKELFFELNISTIQEDEAALLNLRRLGVIRSVEIGNYADLQYSGRNRDTFELGEVVGSVQERMQKVEKVLSAMDDNVSEVASLYMDTLTILIRFTRFGEQFAEVCGLLSDIES